MASGTVGYTDTRGNRDYSSIIANQIGKRLKEASNMASEERAYAAGMAEAGGTSLEEAGIGKGYFFGRALGSRFGGDRIARTRGRMGASGPGTNPAASYKQRFRGGFDYKVENNVITDTAPLSNAVVTGLRGVESGLVAVSQGLAIQGREIGKLSNVTADMAKATMLNGYIFQMFASQQRAQRERQSARREERSIERGTGGYSSRFGGGGGSLGGGGFGGAGGGRGMINVTPRGGGGGAAAFGGGAALGSNFGMFDALSFGSNVALRPGKTNKAIGGALLERTGRLSTKAQYAPLFQQMKDPKSISQIATNVSNAAGSGMFGAKAIKNVLSSGDAGIDSVIKTQTILAGLIDEGKLTKESAAAMESVISSRILGNAKQSEMMDEILDASTRGANYRNISAMDPLEQLDFLKANPASAKQFAMSEFDADTFAHMLDPTTGKRMFTNSQVDKLVELGFTPSAANTAANKAVSKAFRGGRISSPMFTAQMDDLVKLAQDYVKRFPNANFKNVEEAVAFTELGRLTDSKKLGGAALSPEDAVKNIENLMGVTTARKALIGGSKEAMTNSSMMKLIAQKGGRRLLNRLPVIGAIAGTAFAIQRALEGDFKGAGLEFMSGMLGLNPAMTGLGMYIDGYLLARDLGLVPMKTGGRLSGFAANSTLSVNGMPLASFNEPGNPESIQIVRDDKDTPIEQGKGIVEGMLKKKNDYAALTSMGVERGLQTLDSQGFFSGLFNTAKNVGNNLTNPFKGLLNMGSDAKNWFMKGFTPGESSMSWKDLLSNDWMQRQRTQGAGKGMWNPFRGMPGYGKLTSGGEIPGGFQTGPTPAARQAFLRGFALLTNPKAFILGSLMTPTALGDGTLTGNIDYLNSLGIDTSNLQPGSGMGATNATVTNIYNTTNNNGSSNNDNGNEILGQGFNADLEKFITNFSIMSK